jgi:hypothetical protein
MPTKPVSLRSLSARKNRSLLEAESSPVFLYLRLHRLP